MVAIRGIWWREPIQPLTGDGLLEEVLVSEPEMSVDNDPDATDSENDEDQLTRDSAGRRQGNLGSLCSPPTLNDARKALGDLEKLLHPQKTGSHHGKQPPFNPILTERLESMEKFLWRYVDVNNDGGNSQAKNSAGGKWGQAADETASFLCQGDWLSRNLRAWSKAYIEDRTKLPTHQYGNHRASRIEDDQLAMDIKLHLQSIVKYIRGQDIVDYLKNPEVQRRHGLTKTVSLATAQRWMVKLGYRWREEKKGQYVDGHEREDVVEYHQTVFLPLWESFQHCLRNWKEDDVMVEESELDKVLCPHKVILWFHDESTFYAHDC
ncbi:hypothetical protein F4604DRAFT_1931271 [Suillus subluteus]|nr:hypothetical protein F4604DRAFT_1931271 [Suillus subluteus]